MGYILEIIKSIKGSSSENEDVAGFKENYFWILDGATDLFDNKMLIGYSVSEVVNVISDYIERTCNNSLKLSEIIKMSISQTVEKFNINIRDIKPYMLPTFSIILCRIIDNNFEYYILGDCYLAINKEIITDDRIRKFSKKNKELIGKLENYNGIKSFSRLEILRNTRSKANTKNGYFIGSLDGSKIDEGINGKLEIESGTKIFIMSDGFYKYFSDNIDISSICTEIEQDIRKDKTYDKKDDASIIFVKKE